MSVFDRSILDVPYVKVRCYVLVLCLIVFIPWGDLILWRYVYGFINDLSPTTWVVFFVWLGFPRGFHDWVSVELGYRRRLILWLGMVLFYVLALGAGSFDPYAYGYQPWILLAGITGWVIWRRQTARVITLLLGLDLSVYALHGIASDNLWDYLFDPVLMIVLGISLVRPIISRRKIRIQS